MRAAENGPGEGVHVVEPVDAALQPVPADRMRIGIEQHDMRVAGRTRAGLGRLAVSMAAAEPTALAQQPDIRLGPRPGLGSVATALVHDDDLVVPFANGPTDAFGQQPGEEQPVAGDCDDADRSPFHALFVPVMDAPTDPDVTVLMPVRNGARYLEAAVASILAQRHPNFEFIICDDGSTDDTSRILAWHAQSDARIRVLALPPVGLVAALNRGLREARAGWVARMDADDVAWPDRLALQLAAAAAHPEAAGIGSAWRVIDQNGRPGESTTADRTWRDCGRPPSLSVIAWRIRRCCCGGRQ